MRTMSYAEMRQAGLCTQCGKENPTPEKSRCPECRDRANMKRRENYQYYKKIGICLRCKRNMADPGKVFCFECSGENADEYAKKIKNEGTRERQRTQKQALMEKRMQVGLCPDCGKRPMYKGRACKMCRAKSKAYRDSQREDISRSEWVSWGRCYLCGKEELLPGKRVCAECYETRLKTIPKMLGGQHEYWARTNTIRHCPATSALKEVI